MKSTHLDNLYRVFSLTFQRKILGLVVFAVTMFFAGDGMAASQGALDLSFGLRGTSAFNMGDVFQGSRAVAIQPDGKVVLAGYVNTCVGPTCSSDFLVVRFNTDGSLDTSFGTNGAVVTDYSGQDESAFAIAVQTDSKIVVAGGLYDLTPSQNILGFKVVRYMPNGTLDATFGVAGKVYESFDDVGGYPDSLIIQPDGKIVVSGSDDNSMLFVARFNSDGGLDTGFGTNGKIATNTYNIYVTSLVRQSDGKIVIAASGLPSGTLKLIRFNANGTPDSGFGSGGVSTATSTNIYSPTLGIQSTGKIVVSGVVNNDVNIPPLLRFNSDGSPDSSFVPFHGEIVGFHCTSCTQKPSKILILPDDRFYLVGYSALDNSRPKIFAVSRYLSNGTIDSSFGFRGASQFRHRSLPPTGDDYVISVSDAALQVDGKIVVTATAYFNYPTFGQLNLLALRLNQAVTPPTLRGDFDGDRKTDFVVFRPSSRIWYMLRSFDNSYYQERFGADGDVLVPSDFNYDSKTDLAVYRPTGNVWYISPSLPAGGIGNGSFGQSGDISVPEDYDGDGFTDLAVFRPSNGTWKIRISSLSYDPFSLPYDISFPWGLGTDKPVPADYDGDGRADLAVFRPSNGTWYILRSSDNGVASVPFGLSTDRLVQGDYDGDLKTDVAVFRDGAWYILRSSDNGFVGVNWGLSGDKPVPGDYDGDGKFDVAVFRPSTGAWYALKSSDSTVIGQSWGISEDTPIPFTYVR